MKEKRANQVLFITRSSKSEVEASIKLYDIYIHAHVQHQVLRTSRCEKHLVGEHLERIATVLMSSEPFGQRQHLKVECLKS